VLRCRRRAEMTRQLVSLITGRLGGRVLPGRPLSIARVPSPVPPASNTGFLPESPASNSPDSPTVSLGYAENRFVMLSDSVWMPPLAAHMGCGVLDAFRLAAGRGRPAASLSR
jgi:hypothetical protein